MNVLIFVASLMLFLFPSSQSKSVNSNGPDCSGNWPTKMTFGHLKDAGLVNNESIDFTKTKTVRLASEKTGKNLWHQVYHVTFSKKTGEKIEAIAVHDASLQECSMSDVEIFIISRHIQPVDR
jgi:hypothetical protein